MKTFKWTMGKIPLCQNHQSEREKVFNRFLDLFEINETIKDTDINIQLKPGHYSIKQKARPVPQHVQEDVEHDVEKPIRTGHLEKRNDVYEDCFVSPVMITLRSNKSLKNCTRLTKTKC